METQTDAQSVENFQSIFSRIGQLTRVLRDSMTNLGLDRAIMEAADAIPDARDRLNYIVGKTSQAADRALNCVEIARPLQDELNDKANALTERWDAWFVEDLPLSAAKELVIDTRSFLKFAPTIATQTNAQLMEIMMAQDFQDLTGQVIQRMMRLIESLEKELIQVLVENMPDSEALMTEDAVELKNGPQIDQSKAGIVASQDQVDDLLESLGF